MCCPVRESKNSKNDRNFKLNIPNRFKLSKSSGHGSTLRVNGSITSDPSAVLNAWEDHFKNISSASVHDPSPALLEAQRQMIDLLYHSRENEDFVLDTPFTSEEIESVLRNLKLGKSAGYDQVQPEHLKYGGPTLYIWIKQVANAIIELECVPESLKVGIVTPLYKGGGKDPLSCTA